MIDPKNYNIDLQDPIAGLQQIDKIIAELFQLGCKRNRKLINNLNDLLQLHHLLVRKQFFLTKKQR